MSGPSLICSFWNRGKLIAMNYWNNFLFFSEVKLIFKEQNFENVDIPKSLETLFL